MTRTVGSRGIGFRKDKGKKRKFYRGRKVKGIRQIKFEKRKGNKKYIKLRIMERKPMSLEGYRNWNRRVRRHIRPIVYVWGARIDSPVADLTTKADVEEWALTAIGYEGYFLVFGFSGSPKSKTRVKPVRMFDVQIREGSDGLRAKMVRSLRLTRYWFWRG